jgi:hypothetical protein
MHAAVEDQDENSVTCYDLRQHVKLEAALVPERLLTVANNMLTRPDGV